MVSVSVCVCRNIQTRVTVNKRWGSNTQSIQGFNTSHNPRLLRPQAHGASYGDDLDRTSSLGPEVLVLVYETWRDDHILSDLDPPAPLTLSCGRQPTVLCVLGQELLSRLPVAVDYTTHKSLWSHSAQRPRGGRCYWSNHRTPLPTVD